MKRAEEAFGKYLAQKGLRYTKERRLVLQEVMARHDHFNPEDIILALRARGEKVSQASVYRTLPLLIESGIVERNPGPQMNGQMEHVLGHRHHDHLVCLECGRVVEFTNRRIEKLQEQVAREHGFLLGDHRLIISGYCPECQQNKNRGSGREA